MPVKILVADDSATMRQIMEMTFAGEDADVVTVDSGQAAVQKAQELRPDVVFADASMNGVDGYAVASAIKSDPGLANTAVIVLASQHVAFDELKGKSSGVDDHVNKPFDTQVVIDKVSEVLSKPRARAEGAAAAPPPPQPPPPPTAPGPSQATPRKGHKATMAFGVPQRGAAPPGPPQPPPPPRPPAPPARPVLELAEEEPPAPTPPRPKPAPAAAVAAATSSGSPLAGKLSDLGLTKEQMEGVLSLSREVIEQVVWEVVPDLAETLIREEIKRLTSD